MKLIKGSDIETFLKTNSSFTTDDLHRFFSRAERDIPRSTVNWRIYDLVKRGVVRRTGRGRFTASGKAAFSVNVSGRCGKISSRIHAAYPLIRYCVWESSAVNALHQHIPGITYTIVEAEKDAVEPLFHFLGNTESGVFRSPFSGDLTDYLSGIEGAIIVKQLISEAPVHREQEVPVPDLEKILVDISIDKLFRYAQGEELRHIFLNAFEKYAVNLDKLLRYAKRRNRQNMISDIVNNLPSELRADNK